MIARRDESNMAWLWRVYDDLLNRGQSAAFLLASHELQHASFNGSRLSTAEAVAQKYQSLRGLISARTVRLDRILFDLDTVIAPETFANCASIWWIVESTPNATWPGDPVYGATQILFRDDRQIVQIRDVWAPIADGL
jgi:hypothetical protein